MEKPFEFVPEFPSVWDNTTVSLARTCLYKLWLHQFHHWKGKGVNINHHSGACFAKALEVMRNAYFGEGINPTDAHAMGAGALIKAWGQVEAPPNSPKSIDRVLSALDFYVENYPLEKDSARPFKLPGGKLSVEINFVEPLPVAHPETGEPLLYTGRLDQAVEFAGGVYVEDDKTTTSLGASWANQWQLRGQFTGYCWGLERVAGIKATGILVRGVSILKTKHETQQVVTYRSAKSVQEWLDSTCAVIEHVKYEWEKLKEGFLPGGHAFRKDLDKACADFGGCGFLQTCQADNPEPWLNQYFERRKWDPLTRTETLLSSSE